MGRNNASKKLTVLALILFVIFTAVNVFWLITMYIPYCGYSYALADAENKYPTLTQEKTEGEYFFEISKAPYLGYDDYLAVKIENYGNTEGIAISDLFIYPNIWGEYEYAVGCTENGYSFFLIETDAFGNFMPYDTNDTEFNAKAQLILNEKHAEITQLFTKAKECWVLEPKHDFATGIKAIVNGQPFFLSITIAAFLGFFCFMISVFIWLLKYKIPFQHQFADEMNAVYGMAEFNFKRIVGDYVYTMSAPRLFRNDGFLMLQKRLASPDRLSLIICPRKKETACFVAFLNDSKCLVRKANKYALEYKNGNICSTDPLVLARIAEIEDLLVQANLFWGIFAKEKQK